MRANLLILSLLVFPYLSFGQSSGNPIAIEDKEFNEYFQNRTNVPVVTGKILNLTAEEIKQVKITYSVVTPFETLQARNNGQLNDDGSFALHLDYAFPYQQIWLRIGELFYTGIYANTDLYIELDAQLLKSQENPVFNCSGVKYLGTDGALNAYMNNFVLYKRARQLEIHKAVSELSHKKLDYPVFIEKYDSLYSILRKLDNEYIVQNASDYSWILLNERQSAYYGDLCVRHWRKQMPTELFAKVKQHKAYITSNDGMLFYGYLFTYLRLLPANKVGPGDKVSGTLKTVKSLDSLFVPSKSDFLKVKFSSEDPDEHKRILETILPHVSTGWCKTVIQAEYDKTIEKLASIQDILEGSDHFVSDNGLGQPVAELGFGAKLYKVDTLAAEALLSNIKRAFPNKALLIDLWAIWCGPCIKEFPHSKRLNENTKDLPIEFVYLCTSSGSDIAKWKSKVAEFKLSGTHIYVEAGIVNKLLEIFSGSGFPTYVLINTKGEYKPVAGIRPSDLDKDRLSQLIK